jgi:hypothetical protein
VPEDSRPYGSRRADALRWMAERFLAAEAQQAGSGGGGSLIGLVDDDNGEPLNVGRKTRAIPLPMQRALRARDRGCRFPGCTHTRFTEGHHVEHWADGGETKLTNLITLCHFHHHLLHEGGFRVERTDDGIFVCRQPDGRALIDRRQPGRRFRGSALSAFNRRRGIHVRPDTIVTRWLGETMDYSMAMDALLWARGDVERGEAERGDNVREPAECAGRL